jgi:hypothetical protein
VGGSESPTPVELVETSVGLVLCWRGTFAHPDFDRPFDGFRLNSINGWARLNQRMGSA